MLNALLLLAAVSITAQDRVQKFPLQYLSAEIAFGQVKDTPVTIKGLKRVTYDPTDNSLIVQGTDEAIREFSSFLASIDYQSNSRVVPVKNASAQHLYELLTSSGHFATENPTNWLPKNVELAVDVPSNGIRVTGPDPGIREMELLLAQFDIKPALVQYEVNASMPLLNQNFECRGKVANDSTFQYTDAPTRTSIRIVPRINGDKTVTAFIKGGTLGTEAQVRVRVKPGENLFVRFHPSIGSSGGPTILAAYGTGDVPLGFLDGAVVDNRIGMHFQSDGAMIDAPKSAELRLVIKFTIPEK